tara:strand:+ start:440 stop:637 length:198 start_codon:yes stop_codon:yes gene_type:complete
MERLIFWDLQKSQPNTPYKGGWYVRSEISDFVKRLIDQGEEVVGIVIDDSYNVEFITVDKGLEEE